MGHADFRNTDAQRFVEAAEADERLAPYLEKLYEEAAPLVPDRTANLDLFLELLSALVGHAFYFWLSHYARQGSAPEEPTLRGYLDDEQSLFTAIGATPEQIADASAAAASALKILPPHPEALDAGLSLLPGTL